MVPDGVDELVSFLNLEVRSANGSKIRITELFFNISSTQDRKVLSARYPMWHLYLSQSAFYPTLIVLTLHFFFPYLFPLSLYFSLLYQSYPFLFFLSFYTSFLHPVFISLLSPFPCFIFTSFLSSTQFLYPPSPSPFLRFILCYLFPSPRFPLLLYIYLLPSPRFLGFSCSCISTSFPLLGFPCSFISTSFPLLGFPCSFIYLLPSPRFSLLLYIYLLPLLYLVFISTLPFSEISPILPLSLFQVSPPPLYLVPPSLSQVSPSLLYIYLLPSPRFSLLLYIYHISILRCKVRYPVLNNQLQKMLMEQLALF